MAESYQAPKGTRDVVPPESGRWESFVARFAGQVEAAGYGLVQSPAFEEVGVFQRGMGEGTDVVRKEMYDFHDKGDRHLALRPEGTASIARAFAQLRPTAPWKTWYVAPNFRYEQTQAGRYRQHHQVGVEAIGGADPDLDVEVVVLLWDFFAGLGLGGLTLLVNSMGTAGDRAGYADRVRAYFRDHLDELDPDDRAKVEDHPLRVLDTKRPASQAVAKGAPVLLDVLSDDARAHFERVTEGLTAAGVPYEIEPRLVRGLDYYTHTTFEIRSPALDAAQNTIGGGGRYDGLVQALGGPPTPGVGFGAGIERTLLACDAEGVFAPPDRSVDTFVVDVTGGAAARDLTLVLRRAGISADRAFDGRSMKSQMKAADRSGARLALIVGPDEDAAGVVALRDLREGGEQELVPRDAVVEHVRKLLP